MIIIYYSHARNTERFVHRHLAEEVEAGFLSSVPAFRVHADGPHGELTHYTLPFSNLANEIAPEDFQIPHTTDVLFVTPTYGKFNHEIHRAENYTPKPMQQAMEAYLNSRHPSDTASRGFVAVGGNRTFGRDFAKQDRVPSGLTVLNNKFELSGSETEARAIVRDLQVEVAR